MELFAIILSFIPAVIWLLFYLHEDLHPEPKKLILVTFLLGAGFAFIALIAELGLSSLFPKGAFVWSAVTLITFAFIEEITKFAAAYVSVNQNPAFDEPVDAMIYVIIAALGFATVENFGVLQTQASQLALVGQIFSVTATRFVGATLLHTLTSGLTGYYWAISIREFELKRFIVFGLILATGLHAFFNYLIIHYGDLTYALVFVLIISIFILSDFEELKKRAI